MPMRIKDDFRPTDKVFSVPAAWYNAVAKFVNTFCVENGAGAYLRKPVSPTENEPVALVFPEEPPVVAEGTPITLGADQDTSTTSRTDDWEAGQTDISDNPVGVKVWHHRYFMDSYGLYQVSWYELHDATGALIEVSAEGTSLLLEQF